MSVHLERREDVREFACEWLIMRRGWVPSSRVIGSVHAASGLASDEGGRRRTDHGHRLVIVLVHVDFFFLLFVALVQQVLVVAAHVHFFAGKGRRRLMRLGWRFTSAHHQRRRRRNASAAGSRGFVVVVVVVLSALVMAAGTPQLLLGFFTPLPFHATVLEPDFHLGLGQHQRRGHFESLRSRQVLVLPELVLQFQ